MRMLLSIISLVFGLSSLSCGQTFRLSQPNTDVVTKNTANLTVIANQKNTVEKQPDNFNKSLKFDYLGCWSGSKGGFLEFRSHKLFYTAQEKTYSYKYDIISRSSRTSDAIYLLS